MTHKAYLDFMKNVAENLEKRVQHVVNHGVEVLKKENPTQQDVEEVWNEIRSLHKDIGSNAADAAQGEIKERVVNYHQSLGLTKEAAESKFKDVFDLGEKARAAAPQVIGIGGSLTAPPLPHHRAYGSVHGGSRSCANTIGTRMAGRAI